MADIYYDLNDYDDYVTRQLMADAFDIPKVLATHYKDSAVRRDYLKEWKDAGLDANDAKVIACIKHNMEALGKPLGEQDIPKALANYKKWKKHSMANHACDNWGDCSMTCLGIPCRLCNAHTDIVDAGGQEYDDALLKILVGHMLREELTEDLAAN